MNAHQGQLPQTTPDIKLSGEALDQISAYLSNAAIFVKAHDGSMRPFIDPAPIMQIIGKAVQEAVQNLKNEQQPPEPLFAPLERKLAR
jgi:hypothetical protein